MPDDIQDENTSEDALPDRMMRFGSACAVAVAVAVAASLPATLRTVATGAGGITHTWLALAAAAAAPALLVVLLLRSARAGARGFNLSPGFALTLLLWILSSYASLSLIGASLRANTHHHALAGVTFTIVAFVTLAILFLLARRVAHILATVFVRGTRFIVLGTALITVAILSVSIARNAHEHAHALLDGLGLLLFAALGSRPEFVRRRVAQAGPPLLAITLGLGVWALRSSPALRDLLSQNQLFSPVISILGGH